MITNDAIEKIIDDLEHQYETYSISERFHRATSFPKKLKPLDQSLWPIAWKRISFKGYPRLDSITLPKTFSPEIHTSFDKLLLARESTRDYQNKSISIQEISTILYYSSGMKPLVDDNIHISRRFYPSGGARYPLETYIVIYGKSELAQGIYHYNVKYHSLEILKKGNYYKELRKCIDTPWMADACMAIFLTSVWGRNQMKYGDRGYRLVMGEAGNLSQNMYLATTALNLGCCALGGYADAPVHELLDVDGINESVVYSMVIGTPIRNEPKTK